MLYFETWNGVVFVQTSPSCTLTNGCMIFDESNAKRCALVCYFSIGYGYMQLILSYALLYEQMQRQPNCEVLLVLKYIALFCFSLWIALG